jgi:type IV pilus assembly protein PilQ
MSRKQGGIMLHKIRHFLYIFGFGLLLLITQIAPVGASELSLSNIGVVALADNKLQIQLEMGGGIATLPKVFQTDNPARIALDFSGVKNALSKKMYPVNQGAVNNIYVAATTDRLRVVINLLETTQFETKLVDNKVLLTLAPPKPALASATTLPTPVNPVATSALPPAAPPVAPALPAAPNNLKKSAIASLMPEQAISGFDFKRGDKGEGRILISLASPNTIVNTKQQGGKVVLSFVNTRLPSNLSKRLDVSEFATPVKYIDAVSSGREATMTVTMQNTAFDYSSFQTNGLLTVEFRPLTAAEKQAMDRARTKYTGDRLSLHFQEIEVRSAIAILAEFTGQNIVAGDDVTGSITLKLDDVPWDEALDFILMTKELGKYETGNVTLISPLDKIRTYKEKQQATEKVVAALDPLITEYIKINYANAGAIVPLLMGQSAGVNTCTATSTSTTPVAAAMPTLPAPVITTGGGGTGGAGIGGTGSSGEGGTGEGSDTTVGLSAVSTRGSVVVDQRTNTLIVRDTARRLEEIRSLIHRLDVPVRQVMIESRIVIATNNFVKELGVKFGTAKNADAGSGRQFTLGGGGTSGKMSTATSTTTTDASGNITSTSSGVPAHTLINGGTGDAMMGQLVNLATSGTPMGALGMTLVRGADYVLNLELQALQSQGKGELISNPRVMTADRCQASIKQGVQIPYSSSTLSGATTTNTTVFVDAVLELDVTPQITPNGSVIMKLNITNNSPGTQTPTGQIAIDKRELHTNVHVQDGETVVLGGIFQETIRDSVNNIPFFADLPGIGFLFKNTRKQDDKTELLIFVTPKIAQDVEVVD